MACITIENIWTDDDGMLQLDFTASNGRQQASQDFYIYPDELTEFSNDLQNFPKSIKDSVRMEYGKEPDFYCYFLFKAFIWDSVGSAAFELKTDSRQDIPAKSACHFYLTCEVAVINDFGKKLSAWIENPTEPLKYEWKSDDRYEG